MTMLSDGMLLGAGSIAAPLSFVGAAATSRNGSGTFDVTLPSGTQPGDRIIISIMSNSVLTDASGAGCSTLLSDFTSPTVRHAVLTKIASGGEGGVVSVTTTGGVSVTHEIHALVYRGGNGAIDASITSTGTGANSVAQSIIATVPGALIAIFGSGPSFTIATPPAGMTQRAFTNSLQAHAVYELDPSGTGATGNKTLVWSGSQATTRGSSIHIN